MGSSIKNILENRPINFNSKLMSEITTKTEMSEFFNNVIISQIYDEKLKEYSAIVDGYHYVNYYNFFMGMRVTQNRASLQKNPESTSDVLPLIRRVNYKGHTSEDLSKLETSPFGSQNTTYTSNGGYKSAGGYIHYFACDLTFSEATAQYTTMVNDGILDEKL